MSAVNLTSAIRRGATQHQPGLQATYDLGSSSQQADPHVNPQLTGDLRPRPEPRRSVSAAPLIEPNRPIGSRIANAGLEVLHLGSLIMAGYSGIFLLPSLPLAVTGYMKDDIFLKNQALVSCGASLQCFVASGAMYGVERLARYGVQRYMAEDLGTTKKCLREALDIVTGHSEDHDPENPHPSITEGELVALSTDLMNLATVERSRLPPELWRAASGYGDNGACELVHSLLAAAHSRAPEGGSEGASASPAG